MLEASQSAPGSRISGPDGHEFDIVARVATDAGPFVILNRADVDGLAAGVLVSEGALRDHEDVVYVGSTAEAKAEAHAKAEQAEADQIKADRQARIDRQIAEESTTGTTGATGAADGTLPPATV